jgi:multisubunit Na+/H+ antiporter MnhG subunit
MAMSLYGILIGPVNPIMTATEESPSVLSVVIKAALTSGGAAFGSFYLSGRLFSRAHAKTVSSVFSIIFISALIFGALGAYIEPTYHPIIEVLFWLATATPPSYAIYHAWRGEFFKG